MQGGLKCKERNEKLTFSHHYFMVIKLLQGFKGSVLRFAHSSCRYQRVANTLTGIGNSFWDKISVQIYNELWQRIITKSFYIRLHWIIPPLFGFHDWVSTLTTFPFHSRARRINLRLYWPKKEQQRGNLFSKRKLFAENFLVNISQPVVDTCLT